MKRVLLAMVVLAALTALPATAAATCGFTGASIIAVDARANSGPYTLYFRVRALDGVSYFCTTTDGVLATLAATALAATTEVSIVGGTVICPTSGSSRDLGTCVRLGLNP